MKALILAAGYATRLYPLTKDFPKALLAVRNKPIIEYLIDKLEAVDEVEAILVVTNSRFFAQFKKWKQRVKCKKPIHIIDDLTTDNMNRRGAIGDTAFVIEQEKIRGDLLVLGGDNLFDGELDSFFTFAKAHRGAPVIGAFDLADKTHAKRFGVMKLNRQGKIIHFKEKPLTPSSTLVAMCLYFFPKPKLSLIHEYLKARAGKHDATGLYIDWLRKKVAVFGFVFGGRWFDIGDHRFYDEAKESFA